MTSRAQDIRGFIPPPALYQDVVKAAIQEDLGHGDITTACTIDPDIKGKARIMAKEKGVLAGLFVSMEVFRQVDPELSFSEIREEGTLFESGDVLLYISGGASSLLMAERVALNFLQRLCGIATLSRRYAQRIKDTGCRVVGTRKTTPNLRILEKYAIRVGGAGNHRFSLSDGILIKDNHISACGGIRHAVAAAKAKAPHPLKVEVEVTSLDQMREAIETGADAVLLDNMGTDQVKQAVELAKKMKPGIILEASGGINLDNIHAYAATGVDIVSSGSLTHSFRSIDLSMKIAI